MEVVADFLTPLLTAKRNESLEENILSGFEKIASVIPLDKGKPNKNKISNFRSVSISNTFSDVYGKVIEQN